MMNLQQMWCTYIKQHMRQSLSSYEVRCLSLAATSSLNNITLEIAHLEMKYFELTEVI